MGSIKIDFAKNEEELEFVRSSLYAHNMKTSPTSQEPLVKEVQLVMKDERGQIRGGLIGRIVRYALGVEILWVDEALRGGGYGGKLLKEAEEIAKTYGCTMVFLDTYSFQAPDFYKKQGYEVFGTLDGYAEGIQRFFLKKMLNI